MNKKQLKEKYGDEKVFVVPFDKLTNIKDGFTPIKHDNNLWSSFDGMGSFVYRYDAEGESLLQQIIPYIVLFNEKEDKILATKRIKGDERLVGMISVGVGGHINIEDEGNEILFKAATRELMEEVELDIHGAFKIIGYIRDITSSTNDHTGVVIKLVVSDETSIKEKDTLEGQWMSIHELINSYNKLESWSKYIVDHFAGNEKFIKK